MATQSNDKAAADKGDVAVTGLARILPVPVSSLLKEGMSESERARILLVTVSRQLFVALLIAIGASAIIVYAIRTGSNFPAPVLPIVMLCGIVGGFVSIQRRLKDLTMQDLTILAESRIYLILAPFVGGILALVLYVIFLSGLLKGDLFPVFVSDFPPNTGGEAATAGATGAKSETPAKGFLLIFQQHGENFSDYAKLMFWCFVAGFSERFVTDIIGKFEGKAIKTIK